MGLTAVGGASAAPTVRCQSVKGTITIAGTGTSGAETFTGKATGAFAGTLSKIVPTNDFTGTYSIRTAWTFTVTDRFGAAAN